MCLLQRLFSTFPGGWPGVGLLLLRTAVALTLLVQGVAYLGDWQSLKFEAWAIVVLSVSGGILLLAGLLTPVMSLLVMLGALTHAFSLIPEPPMNLLDSKLAIILVIANSFAIFLLGPGAFSLDSRFFGRRQIFIPTASRSEKS